MKKSKIIIPALGLIALSTAASITGTVAWFASNARVTITGMSFTTKVSSNILVAEQNNVADESQYAATLAQARTGVLEPASTINAVNYYFTTNALASGDAKEDVYTAYSESATLANAAAGKSQYDAAFNTAYGVKETPTTSTVVYGYIDQVFYLKATNSAAVAANLNLIRCNLLYNDAALGATDTSWRVGMLVQSASKGENTTAALAAGDLKTILAPTGAVNFTSGKAVSSTSALGDVSNPGAAATVASVSAGATAYYKVTMRLWLEGEDKNCNNETYAALTDSYALDLAFEFDGTAVTALQSTTTPLS